MPSYPFKGEGWAASQGGVVALSLFVETFVNLTPGKLPPTLLDLPEAMRNIVLQEAAEHGLPVDAVLSYATSPKLRACRGAIWWRCRYTAAKSSGLHYPVSAIARAWGRTSASVASVMDQHVDAMGGAAPAKNRAYEVSRRAWHAHLNEAQ